MSETKLKPCPFCGGEASLGTIKYSPCDITKLNNREKGYFVNCQMCSARNEHGISYATEEEAIKHWNTRVCHDDLVKALEEIADHAYRASLVQHRSVSIIKQTCAKIAKDAKAAIAKAQVE